jgi:hypothetical protein
MKKQMFPGEQAEQAYHVQVFIDGLLYHSVIVEARSQERAAVIAYTIAVLAMLDIVDAFGTPMPPPPVEPPEAVQLPLPTDDLT